MSHLDDYNDPEYWNKLLQAIRTDRFSFELKQFFYQGISDSSTTLTSTI